MGMVFLFGMKKMFWNYCDGYTFDDPYTNLMNDLKSLNCINGEFYGM